MNTIEYQISNVSVTAKRRFFRHRPLQLRGLAEESGKRSKQYESFPKGLAGSRSNTRASRKVWQTLEAVRKLPERSGKHSKQYESFPKGLANTRSSTRASRKVWQTLEAVRELPERSGRLSKQYESIFKNTRA